MKNTPLSQTKNQEMQLRKLFAGIALVGLFVCGVAVGLGWRYGTRNDQFTQSQCERVKSDIYANRDNPDKVEKLKFVYSEFCDAPVADRQEVQREDVVKKEVKTCEKIENLLLGRLYDDGNGDVDAHMDNARVYDELINNGCPENQEKYVALKQSELDIAESLKIFNYNYQQPYYVESPEESEKPCEVIERVLSNDLQCLDRRSVCSYNNYLNNAEIYGTLAERGCPENSDKYKELALGQIQIATAVARDEEMARPGNAEIVIDTYKKLQMQQQARDFLNKVQALSDPAIDFILKMEKVLNE